MNKPLKTQGKNGAERLIENQPTHLFRALPAMRKAPPQGLPAILRGPFDPRGGLRRAHSLPLCVTPFGLFGQIAGLE